MANSILGRPGDGGQTRLGSGTTVDKDSPMIEVLGVLDELIASIGVVQSVSQLPMVREILMQVRRTLLELGNQIGADQHSMLSSDDVENLEAIIRAFRNDSRELSVSIPSIDALAAAFADVAKTQCRRAERRLFTLSEVPFAAPGLSDYPVERRQFQYALQYLNRLSDLFILIAENERREDRSSSILNRPEFAGGSNS